jgi:hypothetical protein
MTICQKDFAVTSTIMAAMNNIDMTSIVHLRPSQSARYGVKIEPIIRPAVGMPLPEDVKAGEMTYLPVVGFSSP